MLAQAPTHHSHSKPDATESTLNWNQYQPLSCLVTCLFKTQSLKISFSTTHFPCVSLLTHESWVPACGVTWVAGVQRDEGKGMPLANSQLTSCVPSTPCASKGI